jgi:F-type H+-transporting ATPase subunit b
MYLALTTLLAAEEGVTTTTGASDSSGGIDLLLPAPEELIAGIIAFTIIFFVVWKFALPTFKKVLEDRQAAVTSQLESAEKAKLEAESLLSDYRSQLAGANDEAAQIVQQARDAGEAVKADIVARAQGEAEQIKARANDEIEAERARVAGDIRRQVAALSLDVAERVVGSSIDVGSQRALVDQYIDDLGGVQ